MIRKSIKQFLYGRCPGFKGSFPYYGVKVHFPPRSRSFYAACEQGVFEWDNVRILCSMVRPNTTMIDVGANIGLMAIPILQCCKQSRVVSFEPSLNVLPYLRRTIGGSSFGQRWTLVEKAVGASEGTSKFSLSSQADSLFDGFRDTGRTAGAHSALVLVGTLDAEWQSLGRPEISVIKCDVEGAELDVLEGARECLKATRAAVLVEWNAINLAAYQRAPESLLSFAKQANYSIHSIPSLATAASDLQLKAQMAFTESFLLLPCE